MSKYNFAINTIKPTNSFPKYCSPNIKPHSLNQDTKGYKLSSLNKTLFDNSYRIEHNGMSLNLRDKFGNIVSSAILQENGKNSLTIFDLNSTIRGKGYGTRLLNCIKQKYPNHNINVCASWERDIYGTNLPPHKFYMQNGFVPTDKSALEKLTKWINNGSKISEFPMELELCEMVYKPLG